MEFFVLVIIGIVWFALSRYSQYLNEKRREALLLKYGNVEIVDMIMKKMFWQGQTTEQLIDSLGKPLDIDKKVMKTKTKETWKYNKTGRGRYALRIILEDGYVVGWDNKT
ncbi:DUF2845 domain-containing protein [Thioflexithrix psekupsensis]|uniref:DUF2845 domain-containing protein n=1 Tax=Thioflexithrix psekupsensis TaxID=1570016 RepID=A0A251X451_9GAMM|nr:DUF2845 domain-containing protein [Thioflexithrix psekupsensis]OUD11714.1 DUF2845 domain-containing protein [Thioflexithrix psekupsensis]